jgi:hypothetical protein
MAQGIQRLRPELPARLARAEPLPGLGRAVGEDLRERLLELARRITQYAHRGEQLAKQNEATRWLMQVEGGPHHGAGGGGHDWRRPRGPTPTTVRRLAGTRPHATLDGRQDGVGADPQTGQRVFAHVGDSRGAGGVAV